MGWASSLALHFDTVNTTTAANITADTNLKTRLYHRKHTGALMIQRALYPEPSAQQGICHILMLYPPAGIAGGDTLAIDLDLAKGSHALITTPGAGKWYGKNSQRQANKTLPESLTAPAQPSTNDAADKACVKIEAGVDETTDINSQSSRSKPLPKRKLQNERTQNEMAEYASQQVQGNLAAHSRLEWLPQESIIYNEANMHATSRFDLMDSSSLLTWEISVFGRQAYAERFLQGRYHTGLNIYREGRVVVAERVDQPATSRWFASPLGLADQHIYGSFWAVPSLEDVHSHASLSKPHAEPSTKTVQALAKQALPHYLDTTVTVLRQAIAQSELPVYCTHNYQAVNIRYIGTDVRGCFEAFYQLREVLRDHWWQLEPCRPRIWDT